MHLIIAEKHDAAKRIAQILAGGKPRSLRVAGVEAFQFDDRVVLGLSGHIVGIDYPQGYNNWQKVDCKDLIRAEIVVRPIQEKIISALHKPVSYTHLRAHETVLDLVCRLLLEKKNP